MDIQPHPHRSDLFSTTFFRYPDTQLCEAGAAASALEAILYDDLAAAHIAPQRPNALLLSRRMNVVQYSAPDKNQGELDLSPLPAAVLRSQPVMLSRESLALLGTAATRFVDHTPGKVVQMSMQGKNDHERATREIEALLMGNITAALETAKIKYPVIGDVAMRKFPVGFSLDRQGLADDSAAEAALALVEHGGLAGSNSADGLGKSDAPITPITLF